MKRVSLKDLFLSPEKSKDIAELLAQKKGVLRIMKTCLMINC